MVHELAFADDADFSRELPHGPAFGDPADGILLLQNLNKPRELAFGALWRIEPRNVGALNDAVVAQMAQALEILFKGLQPGVTIQAMLHLAPTDRVEAWTDYRGGLDAEMDTFRLNAFQEASIKEGLAHVDGTRRYRLKASTTLVGVRMTTPVSAAGARRRALSLVRSEDKLIQQINDDLEAQLRPYVAEFNDLRNLCESVLGAAELGYERLDCAAIHREVARLLHPFRRPYRSYNPELPLRRQVLAMAAENRDGGWHFGPDPETGDAWQVQIMSLQEAPARTFPGILSSLHAPPDTDPLALWEVLPDTPLTLVTQVGVPDQRDERSRLRQKRNFAYMQRNTLLGGEDPEKVRLREDLDVMLRNTSQHILHTRVHVALWQRADKSLTSTLAAATQAGRRLDLDLLPETTLGATLFLQSLPLVNGPGVSQGSDAATLTAPVVAGRGAPAARVRRLHRHADAGAALRQPARRGGHLRPVRQFDHGAHHHRGQVALRQSPSWSTISSSRSCRSARRWSSSTVGRATTRPARSSAASTSTWTSTRPSASTPLPATSRPGIAPSCWPSSTRWPPAPPGRTPIGLGQIEKAVCSRALSVFAEWHARERPGEEPLLRDFYDLLMNPTFDDQGRAGGIALAHFAIRRQRRVQRLRGRPERAEHDQPADHLRARQAGKGGGPAIGAAADPDVPADAVHHPSRGAAGSGST